MDINGLLIIIVSSLPFVGVYACMFIVKCTNNIFHFKLSIVLCFLVVYVGMLLLGLLVEAKDTLAVKFMCLNAMCFMGITMTFPFVHKNFRNAYYGLDEDIRINNFNINSHLKGKVRSRALFVAYAYRITFLLSGLGIIALFSSKMFFPEDRTIFNYIACALAFDSVLFFITNAYLRLLVKCPNCKSYVYDLDPELNVYFDVTKKVIKEKILDCVFCKAIYVLDPSIDLNELKRLKQNETKTT